MNSVHNERIWKTLAVQVGCGFGTPSLIIIPVDVVSEPIHVANIQSVSRYYISFDGGINSCTELRLMYLIAREGLTLAGSRCYIYSRSR